MEKAVIVCILGMHRSGTSCLAGSLEARGLFLGTTSTADPYNQKGNRENVRIRELNDEILAANEGAWDRPPVKLEWSESHRRQRDDIISSFGGHKVWGFKDPRTLLTLPFWLEAECEFRLLGTFRHPAAVAASLMNRPGMVPAIPPVQLWVHYNSLMIKLMGSHEFPLINFDWDEVGYLSAVTEASARLGLGQASEQFYAPDLKNGAIASADFSKTNPDAMEIYRELERYSVAR